MAQTYTSLLSDVDVDPVNRSGLDNNNAPTASHALATADHEEKGAVQLQRNSGYPDHANGHINGAANGYTNGTANGYSNGTANGYSNGTANGTMNGNPQQMNGVDYYNAPPGKLTPSITSGKQVESIKGEANITDMGWYEPPEAIPDPLVGGVSNEDLWTLMRRFDKVSIFE